ncbi:MAG: ankyrin repeat domain-containing protein [Candidatus Gastranaerophilales bacterium]|nr:ankyrin repeat domain-containing protein [Candidatus Gastranaerophilales bacterium]
MKLNLLKILFLLMPIQLFVSALAIDLSDYGDFSSRSLILNQQKNQLTQEQKDILTFKKLVPNSKCLIQQIKKNNLENVALLLEFGLDPNSSYMLECPIYIAAKENNFEMLKYLYEHGAKIDKSMNSELYVAVKNKNTEMANFLLDKKANIHYIDSITENTILYLALKNKMYDVAQRLIQKGAKIDAKSFWIIKRKKLEYLIENE